MNAYIRWRVIIRAEIDGCVITVVFTWASNRIDALSNARYRAKKYDNNNYTFEAVECPLHK